MLPDDMRRFRLIEDVFRDCCLAWSYREVRTPTLEYLHLFTATGTLTPGRLSKVYSFLDWDGWSGERVVLRPDGTIPLARLFIDNLAGKGLARLFYVTNIFIFEETGTETREQWQCGAEFIGSAEPVADAEVILLATEIVRNLGFTGAKLSLSHAGVIKASLKQLNLSAEEEVEALDQILEGNWEVFTQTKGIEHSLNEFFLPLMKLRGSSSSFVRNLGAFSSRIPTEVKANVESFIAVTELLDSFDCPYEINLSAIHGFEYYTGICFQFLVQDKKVGGGGRYDDLIPLMEGGNVPACGFALYMDPLMSLMPVEKGTKAERGVTIRQEGKTANVVKACFHLAQALRRAGYVAEMDFNGTKTRWRWVVTVKEDGVPAFVVFDQIKNKTTKATSYLEVLNLVGGTA